MSYVLVAFAARADVRIATWHGDFSDKGPGLLLQDILADERDVSPILEAAPDILLLTNFDFDAGHAALGALQDRLAADGLDLPYLYATRPNSGWPTGLDLDGDGRFGRPRDAHGYGQFSGQGGMALLSRYPPTLERDFSDLLWMEAPDSAMSPTDAAREVQRLSSVAHWAICVATPEGDVLLLTLAATPPVFDGPEDRNGRRNLDEVTLWGHYLDGRLGAPPDVPAVVLGNFNVDPDRGDGLHDGVRAMLAHPRLQDPQAGTDTVTWDQTGPMRVSYVLPDRVLEVMGAGLIPREAPRVHGAHRLVWVDVAVPAKGQLLKPQPSATVRRQNGRNHVNTTDLSQCGSRQMAGGI
ncbi:hypothetical protein GGQ68_000189 [Sagittula marina]|uniref:Endonuclease/exonuclease/phosphatase domain-containing protein n=1 Tax=Sagittula marina TaxID=943940 RepID=A0A7W6DPZ8_9RHOB|nr:endonuclease/exonuclease/phosphatase family protein [Sagittula marina]MBB3983878.1 hypothetical protein [Sagittula marina]